MTSSLRFSDIAELRNEKVDPATCSGSRYIGLEHIEQDSLSLSGWGTAEDVDSQKQRFYEGDVLFGKLRPYFRKVVIAPFDGICSTDIWVVKPVIASDRDFVFYWMASDDFITRATNASEGTRMPRAKWDWVSGFELPEMSLEKRKIVGRILRVMDLTISLNRSISKTLEEIARSIFRSWFVDFDPVKAKMAGEKPVGMDDGMAALFPDSMEDSALGLVPTSWNHVPLTDLFDVVSGGTPRTTEESFWGGAIPWFSVVDAPESGRCFFIKTEKSITEQGVSKSAAKIVRPGVTIISARGTVGKTAIAASPSSFNQSCYGLVGRYGDFYTYLLVKHMVTRLRNIAHGGMFDTITRETFSALTVPNPMKPVINAFEKLVEPMFAQIKHLQYQSEQLATMRDALMPRLISGELQIPEEMLVAS